MYKATEEEVTAELTRMQQRNARLVGVEREAKLEDTVVIDYEGSVDGILFQGGKADDHSLKLGSNSFIPGFEDQLVGAKAGEQRAVNVTFPEQYHAPDLAGKAAVFQVVVKEVQETQVDALDDEFAKDVSEFDTMSALKADIMDKIQASKDRDGQNQMEEQLIDRLLESFEGEVPQAMYETEIDDIAKDFDYRMQSQGLNLETYLKYTGSDMKTFRRTFQDQAERRVKTRLALEKIVKTEQFEISDEQVEEEYNRLAEGYGVPAEQVKQLVGVEGLKKDLAVARAMELVKESARITEISEEEAKARAEAAAEAKTAASEEAKPKKAAAKKTVKKETAKDDAADDAAEAPKKAAPKKKPAAKKAAPKKAESSDEA